MTRIAVVEREKCHPDRCGNFLCIRLCPVNRSGIECISSGIDNKAKIDAITCTGCGICPKRCPFGAIHIINLPEALKSEPIHQYGYNDFRLFNLPQPMFGSVVGLLGRNGIGKSTAIKILAGVLSPNLGKYDQSLPIDSVIEYFRGTEMQKYFQNMKEGKIKVAYKPQQVDLIPKQFSGSVRALLMKADEKGELEKISLQLGISKILDSDIKLISGGELQRVAIAATSLRKANVYIFDEPTSYLDIKQRLRLSKYLRNLADPQTAVIVVEHDLIVLDHVADFIQLMYGESGAYGVVSGTKSTRVGINVYLSGYLKEENIRFRDHSIKFLQKIQEKRRDTTVLTTWQNVKHTLGQFAFLSVSGNVPKRNILGILGENGIGKSTFLKILAGEIIPNSGHLDKKLKIAYKPQYLDSDSEEVVSEYLRDAILNYDAQLVRPLDLMHLFDSKLNELSGGELQRVMIAKTLSQDAELYLLDEPSAYLDVEQRLIISKVIRERMEFSSRTALVIDHDLLFLDYLSDELLVFFGEPAVSGFVEGPFSMEEGMNKFLTDLNITMRRDPESFRPRINKEDSQLDRKQKEDKRLYY